MKYPACPDGGDQVATVLEHIEDLNDSSGISKHRDTGIRYSKIEGQVVCGLQR